MNVARGVEVRDRRAKRMEPLLFSWIRAIELYAEAHGKKNIIEYSGAYWFNERANISLLAAGAWLKGAVALEEYSTKRNIAGNKGKNGRADLYIKDGRNFDEFEAKYKWTYASSTDAKLAKCIKGTVGSAVQDAKNLDGFGSDCQFGCAFFVPLFRKDAHEDYGNTHEQDIRTQLSRYTDSPVADIWAWSFPPQTRKAGLANSKALYLSPGVILGIKAARGWRAAR